VGDPINVSDMPPEDEKLQRWSGPQKWPKTIREARSWFDFDHEQFSVREQCRLLGFHGNGICYDPQPETQENLRFMHLMNEGNLRHFAGAAAERLRANLDAAVHKHAVLGLVFLTYVSDAYELRQRAFEAPPRDPGDDYRAHARSGTHQARRGDRR